jgi:clan AA aspartic protease
MTKSLQGWWDADLAPHLALALPNGEQLDLVVDSGFNGEVTLPLSLVRRLKLRKRGFIYNQLADGSTVRTPTFRGEIFWFGQPVPVLVQATGADEGLLGTELFQGCKVELDPDADLVIFRQKTARRQRR